MCEGVGEELIAEITEGVIGSARIGLSEKSMPELARVVVEVEGRY